MKVIELGVDEGEVEDSAIEGLSWLEHGVAVPLCLEWSSRPPHIKLQTRSTGSQSLKIRERDIPIGSKLRIIRMH